MNPFTKADEVIAALVSGPRVLPASLVCDPPPPPPLLVHIVHYRSIHPAVHVHFRVRV